MNYNDTTRNSDVFRGSWDYAFSPTVFNHFYGGGNNWKENHDPPQATVRSGIDWKDKVCIGNVPDCDQNLLNFNFSNNYSQWGGRANNGSENFIKMFADDLTIVKGKHTWKMGGQAQYQYYNGFGRQCVSGCVSLRLQEYGTSGRHKLRNRRWQPGRFHAARTRECRLDRHDSLHRPAVAIVRRLHSGRLACSAKPDVESRPALGDDPSADRRERQLERLRSQIGRILARAICQAHSSMPATAKV